MARFILRYRGPGTAPDDAIALFRDLPGATVIDESPRMLLVDSTEQSLRNILEKAPEWVMSPETSYSLPEPHPVLQKSRSLKRSK